jgi:Undecaprenyl-phosphate glucose phosphotransferase
MALRNDNVGSLTALERQALAEHVNSGLLGLGASTISARMAADAVIALDVLCIVACSLVSHIAYNVLVQSGPLDLIQNAGLGLVAGFLTVLGLARTKSYDIDQLLDFNSQIGRIISSWVLSTLALVAVAFTLKISEQFSRGWVLATFFLVPLVLLGERSLIAGLLARWMELGYMRRNVAIVGAGPLCERLCTHLAALGPRSGLRVIGIFDDRRTRVVDKIEGFPVLGTVNDLFAFARSYRLDEIILALPWSAEARVAALVDQLSALPADIRICPDFVGLRFFNRPYSRVGEIALLQAKSRPIKEWSLILKTLQDYVVAIAGLLLAAPLMAAIAFAIKLDSPGPIFFKQRRRGFNQNMFRVWKFRTMSVLEDGTEIRQVMRDDQRVTRVGRFLRRTSLDELPQLVNVLQGQMSIVGPRPHAVEHDDYYETVIARYASRHRVKPGITGWAQVNGYRGETETVDKMAKRIEYDLHYMENWSLTFDLKIIVLTLFKGFWHHNAY